MKPLQLSRNDGSSTPRRTCQSRSPLSPEHAKHHTSEINSGCTSSPTILVETITFEVVATPQD